MPTSIRKIESVLTLDKIDFKTKGLLEIRGMLYDDKMTRPSKIHNNYKHTCT